MTQSQAKNSRKFYNDRAYARHKAKRAADHKDKLKAAWQAEQAEKQERQFDIDTWNPDTRAVREFMGWDL